MRFNVETLWPRLKNDYKGLLTEYDAQRDSILELCFYVARRVAMYDEMIDMLTPDKVSQIIQQATEEYFAGADFTDEIITAINDYFEKHPIEDALNAALEKYLADKDFTPEVETAVNAYLAEHPAEKEEIKQVFNEEIIAYIEQIANTIVMEEQQENILSKEDWTTEYNNGARFVVSDLNYLYYLRNEQGTYKAKLITAVHSVNGQTGDVTLDAADVGAASIEDLDSINQRFTSLVTGVSSVNSKSGAVVLNAEDVEAAYIDEVGSEEGPAPKINADLLEGKDVQGVLTSNVSAGIYESGEVICAGYTLAQNEIFISINFPYTLTGKVKTMTPSTMIIVGNGFIKTIQAENFTMRANNPNLVRKSNITANIKFLDDTRLDSHYAYSVFISNVKTEIE